MLLHEYQAKNLLKSLGVNNIPIGYMCSNIEDVYNIAEHVFNESKKSEIVIKAQVHAGGRGKAGGIKKAKSPKDAVEKASNILGKYLVTPQTGPAGKLVRKIYIEESLYYGDTSLVKEYYLSLTLDRRISDLVIIYSPYGGMDIEEIAEKEPSKIFKMEVNSFVGLENYKIRKVLKDLEVNDNKLRYDFTILLKKLFEIYYKIDASLIEINPLIKTSDNNLYIADCKISIDDNSTFRHPELIELRDVDEEDPLELELSKHKLNFVKLNGNVGCMVNGAGLAMATMDFIKLIGGEPANFLDVGGTANAQTVEIGFRALLSDPNVKLIFVNIFGGIVRCDRVASGIVEAYKKIGQINIPIVVRLQGTNAEQAKTILQNSGLKIFSVIDLNEAEVVLKKLISQL